MNIKDFEADDFSEVDAICEEIAGSDARHAILSGIISFGDLNNDKVASLVQRLDEVCEGDDYSISEVLMALEMVQNMIMALYVNHVRRGTEYENEPIGQFLIRLSLIMAKRLEADDSWSE
ncbi:hypothetical protein DRH14_02470 [Candidatus Shapirobacteria bacterium]|nr:MAG: hypothetical protein DRH14_02470 [Candidatus Shapirobacteria bacterium]